MTMTMTRQDKLNIEHISVWDFDDTLVYTETPEEGRKKWLMHYDNLFPYKTDEYGKSVRAWWSRPESLNTEVLFHPRNEYVRGIYEKSKEIDNTLMIMLTGRLKALSDEVEAILDMHDYEFDRYYYNPKGWGTDKYKAKKMEQLLTEFKNVKVLDFYDDRDSHITFFRNWGKEQAELREITINIHHIK